MSDEIFLARPTKAQYEWQDMEIGMFFHWFPMGEVDRARMTDPAYQLEVASKITCSTFDARQWVQSAVDVGAKYIVFVAKHGLGLCRWKSDFGVFNFNHTAYQGDPVGELYAACKEKGLKMGVYIAGDSMTYDVGHAGQCRDRSKQAEYNEIYRGWLTELLSKYGEMVEVWFDGSLYIEVGDILKKYAPNAMVFQSKWATIRWVGQEEGYASDPAWNSLNRYDALTGIAIQRHGDPDGEAWLPLECDARLRKDWGYRENLDENPIKSVDQLMDMYYRSVGHGAVLLINHAPTPEGAILDEDMARMKAFGDEIRRRFGHPLATTAGAGEELVLDLKAATDVDHVILMEDIRFGERVRVYIVEGWDGEKWVRLSSGTAIGHKKIDFFPRAKVQKLRLRVLSHVGEPLIRAFLAIFAGVTPQISGETVRGEHKVGEFGTEMYDLATNEAHFSYALGAFVDDAGQYLVSFKKKPGGTPLNLTDAWVEVDGLRMDDYVTPAEDENAYHLYLGGVAKSIVFHAVSKNESRPFHEGEVFIRRIS